MGSDSANCLTPATPEPQIPAFAGTRDRSLVQPDVTTEISPDSDQMYQHLDHLFGRALDGLVEIAWTNAKGAPVFGRLFELDQLEDAAEFAANENRASGVNVYVGGALRKPTTQRTGNPSDDRTEDDDFLEAWACWSDFDKDGAARAAFRLAEPAPPTFGVVTGRHPHQRAQFYFDQETSETDPAALSAQLRGIASVLGGDTTVCNPGRILRLAGSIAWPYKPGRIVEMTSIAKLGPRKTIYYLPGALAKAYPPLDLHQPLDQGITDIVGRLSVRKVMAAIRRGDQWHNHMLKLTGNWVERGLNDDEILATAESLTLPGYTADQTRADMARMIRGAREKWAKPDVEHPVGDDATEGERPDSRPFPATDLVGTAPARKWLVQDWIPLNTVTSLYGDGGTGKTLLAQQLAYAADQGGLWLSLAVQKAVSLCVFCEDQRDELHRRHEAIKAAMGHQIGNPFADVHLWPRVGHDNLLVTFDAQGKPQESPFFQAVLAEVQRLQAQLLILDTAADLFGGNEIDRVQVNHFVKAVVARAIRKANEAGRDMAVLLLAHPSVAGMASKSGTSGSTAWNAAVRSRLYLTKPEDGGSDERVLTRMKANYANAGDETAMPLLWKDGVLIPLKNDADAVTKIEIRRLKSEIRDRIASAEAAGKPYKYDRTHPRELYRSMFEELAPAAREDVINAIKELTRDDEITKEKSRQIRGWKCVTD